MKMTLQNAINRGYNLLACTALALAGLAFGTIVFEEADLLDKVDDIGFLVIGAVAVIWYLVGRNRFKRSVMPIILSGITIIVQIVGLVLEKDNAASFGDNIGGMWLFVPLFVVLVVQFYVNRRLLTASAEVAPSEVEPASGPSAISAESRR
jgi:uncharacterized membrane protein